ncbi:MAG: hypothetical protein GY724_10410 [Actinomycetia bacterium]|nr:hypothetical protein [Actinomycetes bacterium]MCP5035338.1 hypothetical protein [Actinomycetes bacterium]
MGGGTLDDEVVDTAVVVEDVIDGVVGAVVVWGATVVDGRVVVETVEVDEGGLVVVTALAGDAGGSVNRVVSVDGLSPGVSGGAVESTRPPPVASDDWRAGVGSPFEGS